MMGGQFENVDGTATKLSEIDFGTGFTGPEYGDGESYVKTAPQIQTAFVNREGTSKYYFLSDGKIINEDAGEYAPGWVDADGNEADPEVSLGLGFWYKDAYNQSRQFTFKGNVLEDAVWEKTFNVTFRMLVSPYPKAVKLSEITFVGIDANATEYGDGAAFVKTATQIQIPFANREGFTKYYYLSDGKIINEDAGEYAPGWVDADGNEVDPTTVTIPAGRGCWFRPRVGSGNMTVQFTK